MRSAPPAGTSRHLPGVTAAAAPGPHTEPPAFRAVWVAPVRARVWRYLRFLGCAPDLADDFAQDTLLAALRAFPTAEPPMAWLCTTAKNHLRMHLRTAGREVADLDVLHAQWAEVAGDAGGDTQLVALRRCLDELPARSRRALELRYGDGVERTAIARELGLGEEGVKSLLVRLRAVLAACMQRRVQEDA